MVLWIGGLQLKERWLPMNKNKLLRKNEKRIRVLKEDETMSLIIDCVKETMLIWVENFTLEGYEEVDCLDEEDVNGNNSMDGVAGSTNTKDNNASLVDDLDTLNKEERKLAL
jgi:hypothetical protein